MQLPNPFSNEKLSVPNLSSVPSSIAVPCASTINPGPGLPQAQRTTYHYTAPPPSKNQYGQKSGGFKRFSFSCDRCDRSFEFKELLDIHISEHVPCGIDGCSFVAHPKIVDLHIKMQHETGLASKIMKLTNPEEIEKWKEERRKNFPSAANVARRQAEQKEKLERGEVLYEPKKRFAKQRGGANNQRGKGRGRGRAPENIKPENSVSKTAVVPQSKTPLEINPVSNPPPVKIKVEKELSDGEIDSDVEEKPVEIKAGNALTSLMGCYASDSEDELKTSSPAKKIKIEEVPDVKEVVSTKEVSPNLKKRSKNRKKKGPRSKKESKPSYTIGPKRLTLLQKLLEKDIIRERNIIFQCVTYIVQQKFFGIGLKNVAQKEADTIPKIFQPSNPSGSRCAYFI